MTCLTLQRIEYFYKNQPVLEDFLNWCLIGYRYLWCGDEEKHKPEICGCTHTKINFLLPIVEEFKKTDILKEQKKAFLY